MPRKNIRPFNGKPILAYSIENAQKCGLFDEIVVSTDDHEIAQVAWGLDTQVAIRDEDDGSTGTQELARAYLRTRTDVGICCVLYATAPLLEWFHLVQGFQALHRPAPFKLFAHSTDSLERDIGGYYWGFAQAFRDGLPLKENSTCVTVATERCIDINTESDFAVAEAMYQAIKGGSNAS